MVKTYVKCMVLDPCVKRPFYYLRLTHVLRTVNVRCTFCFVLEMLIVLLQEIMTPWVSCLYLSFATAEWSGTKLDRKQELNHFY